MPRQEVLLCLVVQQDDGKLRCRFTVAFIMPVVVVVLISVVVFVMVVPL